MIWLGLALVLAGVAIWPFRKERQRNLMDAEARKGAPGQFAQLSQGLTHYRWFGPEDGPVAVCVHGLTTPSYVWEGLAPHLVEMGYRVLTYDHYGRGYSDRPKGLQDRAFFLRQFDDLLADQQVTGDLTLIGYSMGGAVVTAVASDRRDKIKHLALIAPAGIRLPKLGWQAQLGRRPWVGDWLTLLTYPAIHRKGVEAERGLPSSVPGIVDKQLAELDYQGFTPAVLSSFRGLLSEDLHPDHRKIAEMGTPVLAVLGGDDPLIPPTVAPILRALNSAAKIDVIEGAGHGLTYTHTDALAQRLRAFLGQPTC